MEKEIPQDFMTSSVKEMENITICKHSGDIAHDYCPETEIKKISKISNCKTCEQHKKLNIRLDRLEMYHILETEYKVECKNPNKIRDYKIEFSRAIRECERCKGFTYKKLRKLYEQVGESIRKTAVVINSNEPLAAVAKYRNKREFFGDISDKTWGRLNQHIRKLIFNGHFRLNNKTNRELQRKFNLYGEKKDWIKFAWKNITEEYDKEPSEIQEQLKDSYNFEWPHSKLKTIITEKPFNFDNSTITRALINGCINNKEARILRYRYGLDGGGCYSLRVIANWFGESHTTVNNIIEKALISLRQNGYYL